MKSGAAFLLIALFVTLQSCSSMHTLIRMTPSGETINGIDESLQRTDVADVIFVHGMCVPSPDWPERRIGQLATALGMKRTGLEAHHLGTTEGMIYADELQDADGKRLRAYAIVWAPIVIPAKRQLCYDVTKTTDTCTDPTVLLRDTRATANAALKNVILDGCLADAMYYAGNVGGPKLRAALEIGLRFALSGGKTLSDPASQLHAMSEETNPLYIVTESLASKMVADTIIGMANTDCNHFKVVAHAVSRIAQVSMWANQVPMISLAYNPLLSDRCNPKASASAAGVGALALLHRLGDGNVKGYREPQLHVAAYTDPNDILSWTLYPVRDQVIDARVVDVVSQNRFSYFGAFENPYTAHTTYDVNPVVMGLLVCGNHGPATRRCPRDTSGP